MNVDGRCHNLVVSKHKYALYLGGEGARRVVSGCCCGGEISQVGFIRPSFPCARLRDGMNTAMYGGG